MREWNRMLPEYCKENEKGLLWPGRNGGRRSTGHWWGRILVDDERNPGHQKQVDAFPIYLARAGIKRHFRTHDTRHTCGTALLSGEWGPAWTLEAVRDQLNHSDIRTTQRYARLTDDARKKAARATRGFDLSPQLTAASVPLQNGTDTSVKFERSRKTARNRWRATEDSNL
jgi:hypothetical protein